MLNEALWLSCGDLPSAQGKKMKLVLSGIFFLGNLLSLHPVTNGWRLQVGDQAHIHITSTPKLCLEEAIC